MESGTHQHAACSELPIEDARKLSTVCDAEGALFPVCSPGSLHEPAGSRSTEKAMQAYLDTLSGKPLEPFASCSEANIQSLIEDMQRHEQEEREKNENMEELYGLSYMELEKLEGELLHKLSSIHYMKETLLEKTCQYIVKKEQDLLRDNKNLRKELELIIGRKTLSLGCKVNGLASTCNSSKEDDP